MYVWEHLFLYNTNIPIVKHSTQFSIDTIYKVSTLFNIFCDFRRNSLKRDLKQPNNLKNLSNILDVVNFVVTLKCSKYNTSLEI